jgi:hypothetical protein
MKYNTAGKELKSFKLSKHHQQQHHPISVITIKHSLPGAFNLSKHYKANN